MPKQFQYSFKIEKGSYTSTSGQKSSYCREIAKSDLVILLYNFYAAVDQTVTNTYDDVKDIKFTATVKTGAAKRYRDVLTSFLVQHYPTSVKVTEEKAAPRWGCSSSRSVIYTLTGNHWVVNAWWWSVLFFRVLNTTRVKQHPEFSAEEMFRYLIRCTRSSDYNMWEGCDDREDHLYAFDRIRDALPLWVNDFRMGPCSVYKPPRNTLSLKELRADI